MAKEGVLTVAVSVTAGCEQAGTQELRELPSQDAEECAACLVDFSSHAEAGQVILHSPFSPFLMGLPPLLAAATHSEIL